MKYTNREFILMGIIAPLLFSAQSLGQQVCTFAGSGSTAAQPYYNAVIAQFNPLFPQSPFTYDGVGSGAGVAAFLAGLTQYAGTDNFLTNAQLGANPDVLHFPSGVLAVTLAYNLPGDPALILNADILSKIYQGSITNWNDAEIATLNPSIILPNLPILPVFRTDSSGTTNLFTNYLFISGVGYPASLVGSLVAFPGGAIGVAGSSAVLTAVAANSGAIGYVAYDIVSPSSPPLASIVNSSGNTIAPTLASIEAALEGISIPTDLRILSLNTPNADGYPIANPTFIIVNGNQPNNLQARDIKQFLYFIVTQGQTIAPGVNIAPLPEPIRRQYRLNLLQIESIVTANATSCSTSLCPLVPIV